MIEVGWYWLSSTSCHGACGQDTWPNSVTPAQVSCAACGQGSAWSLLSQPSSLQNLFCVPTLPTSLLQAGQQEAASCFWGQQHRPGLGVNDAGR